MLKNKMIEENGEYGECDYCGHKGSVCSMQNFMEHVSWKIHMYYDDVNEAGLLYADSFYDDENDKELYYLANDLYQMHHAEDSDIIHHLEKIRKEMKKRYTLK